MKVIGAAASHNRLQINEKISSEKLVIFPFGNVDVFHHMVSKTSYIHSSMSKTSVSNSTKARARVIAVEKNLAAAIMRSYLDEIIPVNSFSLGKEAL